MKKCILWVKKCNKKKTFSRVYIYSGLIYTLRMFWNGCKKDLRLKKCAPSIVMINQNERRHLDQAMRKLYTKSENRSTLESDMYNVYQPCFADLQVFVRVGNRCGGCWLSIFVFNKVLNWSFLDYRFKKKKKERQFMFPPNEWSVIIPHLSSLPYILDLFNQHY